MPRKKSFRFWIPLGVCWVVLAFVMPQTSGKRAPHPFFNWVLFGESRPYGKILYRAVITKCNGVTFAPPKDVLFDFDAFPKDRKYKFFNRFKALFPLLDSGDYEKVRQIIKPLIHNSADKLIGCECIIQKDPDEIPNRGKKYLDIKWQSIEETKIEI